MSNWTSTLISNKFMLHFMHEINLKIILQAAKVYAIAVTKQEYI